MTSKPGKQTVAIHILPSVSKSEGHQTMKLGELIEHDMRNISIEKSCTKFAGEAIPRQFSKKSNLKISLNQKSKFLFNLFYCTPSR